jgi:LPS sulfotransferase NodH
VPEMGDPREYFSPVHIHEESKIVQAKEDALTFSADLIKAVPNNDYFSFKIHYLQFYENFICKEISLLEAFPGIKVIFLRRSNIVAQAISLWKAELTQSWINEMEQKRNPHYNFGEIRNRYYDLKIHDLMWEKYLQENNIPFLNIIYEDMEKNEKKFFYNIFSFLGEVSKFSQMERPSLIKQANAQTLEWEGRFKKEFRSAPHDQNKATWIERTKRWRAEELGEDPAIWRQS